MPTTPVPLLPPPDPPAPPPATAWAWAAIAAHELRDRTLAVLLAAAWLADTRHHDRTAGTTAADVAELTGLAPSTVARTFHRLAGAGLLVPTAGGRHRLPAEALLVDVEVHATEVAA